MAYVNPEPLKFEHANDPEFLKKLEVMQKNIRAFLKQCEEADIIDLQWRAMANDIGETREV